MWGQLPQFQRSEEDPEYKKIPPGSIYEYRNVPTTTQIVLPELLENRKCTDIAFLIFFILFLCVMIGFTVYFFVETSKSRHEKQDDNLRYDNPQDNRDYQARANKNRPKRSSKHYRSKVEPKIDVKYYVLIILAMLVVSLVLSFIVLLCLRWSTKCCFWALTGLQLALSLLMAVVSLLLFVWTNVMQYLISGVLGLIVFILLIIVIWCLRKKIKLIILVYEEATIAMFTVKALLFTPILTIIAMLAVMTPISYVPFFLEDGTISFEDTSLKVYLFFMTFSLYWLAPFIDGSQTIVVAGSVAAYYFSRDKSNIRSPYCNSLCAYIRFHMGTVAAGAFIIAILTMIKNAAKRQQEEAAANRNLAGVIIFCLLASCAACLEEIAEYLTQKAYIMTAIHGKSLCQSGIRACRLLWSNLMDTLAIDGIGTLAISGAAILILLCSFGVGFGIAFQPLQTDYWIWNGVIPLCIGGLCAIFVTAYYLQVLSVSIETIFLCFCEDKVLNNGTRERPYFMSPKLLEIVQTAYYAQYGNPQQPPNQYQPPPPQGNQYYNPPYNQYPPPQYPGNPYYNQPQNQYPPPPPPPQYGNPYYNQPRG